MKLIKLLILVFLFSFENVLAQSQEIVDSLYRELKTEIQDTTKVNIYNSLCWQYFLFGDSEKAKQYGGKALVLSETIQFKKGQALALNYIGNVYAQKAEYTQALRNYFASLEIKKELGDEPALAASYNNIGNIFWNLGNLPEALKYHLKALKIREKVNNQFGVAQSYLNIGNIYLSQNNQSKALENYRVALAIQLSLDDKQALGFTYNNIGNVYENLSQSDSSMYYLRLAKVIREQLGDKWGLSNSYFNIGINYKRTLQFPQAILYMDSTLSLATEIEDKLLIARVYLQLSIINIDLKKYAQANINFQKSLSIATQLGAKEIIRDNYFYKGILDTITKHWESAYTSLDNYYVYRDSLVNEENRSNIVKQQMQFDFDKIESVLKEQQEKEREVSRAKQKTNTIVIGSIIAILILVSIFLFIIFNRFKITKQQKIIIEEKQREITDSIKYAQRIQKAILPGEEKFSEFFPDVFIFYKPKDIVSGDFYWISEIIKNNQKKILYAVADCTGHGVPGAFMSMIGNSLLNQIVNENGIDEPSKILELLRNGVINALNQTYNGENKDGMDIALCSIEKLNDMDYKVEYAGANNSLWIIPPANDSNEKTIVETKADKQPIGIFQEVQKPFTNHSFTLSKGSLVYIFTDGYADQFGGLKGKKFKYQPLKDLLIAIRSKNMVKQKILLNQTFEKWQGKEEQVDDICMIGVRL
ncbi:MAG: tetratricopeptide repeat protein [Bacteroidetes bacterium]|nr:tetratricopeptide repeat protein [Bacteroidota bacterium]HET6244061.1 tetratricopeptide repeat protein [Bacteroidia bacterium]